MQRWAAGAPSPDVAIPAEPIRCLGRVLWGKQKRGLDSVWVRVGQVQFRIILSLFTLLRRARWMPCNLVRCFYRLGEMHGRCDFKRHR